MPYVVKRWTKPNNYAGASWPDYFSSGVGRSRDSSLLEAHNFEEMLIDLGGESDTVLVIHESHWAVAWVEWIAIHESDTVALEKARKLCDRLNDYPILKEDAYCEKEWNATMERWESMRVKDRIEAIKRSGADCSIFAARRQDFPEDDNGALFDWVRPE